MSDFVGRTLGAYKLEAMLGKGGMATVYRAFQTSVKRYVAIKVMSPEIADQPGFVERFSREAEVIASLEHPHILPVIDYGTENGIHYLVMRYIEGGSLDDKMRKADLSLQENARLLSQIASALNYAHDRGVIHRDMKPNNVLLDKQDNAYITDFGIARLVHGEHKLTSTGSILGTPAYMAPEQAMGQPVDARADIYTLGVMLYEMVLNRLPFVADTPVAMIFQHVHENPADPAAINPNLSPTIVGILKRAMAKNPDERYQSANELASAFSDAVANRTNVTPVSAAVPPDMEGTFVGGPLTPMPVSATKAAKPASPTAPQPHKTMAYPAASGEQVSTQPARRSPLPYVIGLVVALLVLLGGAFIVINNNNAAIAAQQTQTQVAVIALSATATSTNTPVATSTSTPTAPPTKTSTPAITATKTKAPTITPNLTRTAYTERLDMTATALLKRTNTPVPPTATAKENSGNNTDNSAADSTIAELIKNGVLDTDAGEVVASADKIDLVVDDPDTSWWNDIENPVDIDNFVVSSDVSWDSPDEHMECGIAFRFTPATGKDTNWTYYVVSLQKTGYVQAWVRDESGYRTDPLFSQQTDVVQTDNRAVNHLMVIGEEDTFRIFVNDHYIGKFSEDTYKSGHVLAFGSRFKDSQGLVCKFRNVWVWQISQ